MWCTTSTSTCTSGPSRQQPRPHRDARPPGRTAPPPTSATAAARSVRGRPRSPAARQPSSARSRTCWYGCPSAAGKTVRSTSCRAITSPSAASSAAGVQVPVQPQRQRDVVGRATGPPAAPRNHSRCCANDNGTRSGRGRGRQRQPRRARLRRAAPPARAGVGASNTARTASSAPSTDRIRLTSRTASSEWPPRAKKSSSAPTRSTPSTSANSPHSISSATVAGARPAAAAA